MAPPVKFYEYNWFHEEGIYSNCGLLVRNLRGDRQGKVSLCHTDQPSL